MIDFSPIFNNNNEEEDINDYMTDDEFKAASIDNKDSSNNNNSNSNENIDSSGSDWLEITNFREIKQQKELQQLLDYSVNNNDDNNRNSDDSSDNSYIEDKEDENNDDVVSVAVPLLSETEAEQLKDKLDDLTDDEIKNLFRKIRVSLDTDRTVTTDRNDEVISSIGPSSASLFEIMKQNKILQQQKENDLNKSSSSSSSSSSTSGTIPTNIKDIPSPKKNYSKSKPINPEIRQKYNEELTKVENELEALYKDPISVWEELIKNPDFMNDIGLDDNNDPFGEKKGE